MDPSTYKDAITGADAVVHTVGMLFEDNYKDVLHSQSFEDLTKNVQSAIRGQNPLDTNKVPKSGLTYEKVNRDTGKKARHPTQDAISGQYFLTGHGIISPSDQILQCSPNSIDCCQ